MLSVAWATFNTKTWTTPRWASSTSAHPACPSGRPKPQRNCWEEGGGRGEAGRCVGWDAEPIIWTKSKNWSACRFMLVRTITSKTQPELALQRISKFFKRRTTCALRVNLFEHLEEAKLFDDPKCFLHLSAVHFMTRRRKRTLSYNC